MIDNRYWGKRALERKKLVDATITETLRKVRRAHVSTFRNIKRDVQYWLYQYADANGISYAEARKQLKAGEMEEYRMTLEEYIEHGEKLDIDPSWENAMIKASALHHVDRLTAVNTITRAGIEELKAKVRDPGFIDKIAQLSFEHSMFAIDAAVGLHVGFGMPDLRKAILAARKPWAPDGMDFVQREGINNDKLAADVEKMITQACIKGESYGDLAQELSDRSGLAEYDAERIIRTEATNAATNGEKAAYEDAGIDEYEVLETLDIKTCDVCGEMDGHVDKVKDMEAGVNAPPFHPNCRGTTIAHFDDEDDIDDTRIARDKYGNPIHVDGDTTWEEWNKQYGSGEALKSGALAGAFNDKTDPYFKKREAIANRLYEEIRNRNREYEIAAVAKNSGFSREDVDTIFAHIFEKEHLFADGSVHQFDSSYYMAQSWIRIREGTNIQEHDLIMLHHELEEAKIMNTNLEIPYEEAHNKAEEKWNYNKALFEYLKTHDA